MSELENVKSKTYYVLDSLFFKWIEELKEIAPYYDSLNEYEKKKLKLKLLILKLAQRNETLAKLLYVRHYHYFADKPIKPAEYLGKRGKKDTTVPPLKLIMEVLKCSHRSAQAYRLYCKGELLADEVWNDGMKLLAEMKAKEG